jgi:hypothetical protein
LQQTVNGVSTNYTLDLNAGLTQVLSDDVNAYLYSAGRMIALMSKKCSSISSLNGRTDAARQGKELWKEVKPLVEKSWQDEHTEDVIRLAREILEIIDLPQDDPPLSLRYISTGGIPEDRDDKPPEELIIRGICRQCSDGGAVSLYRNRGYGKAISVGAVASAQRAKAGCACCSGVVGGRYSFRKEKRTLETPFLRQMEIGQYRRSLAIYLLIDRAGSMYYMAEQVRLAAMALYLVCQEIGLPLAIAYFGGDEFIDGQSPVDEIVAFEDMGEMSKAMIAGYRGHTGAQLLDFALRLAEKVLQLRHECPRVIVIVHTMSIRLQNGTRAAVE